MEKSWVIFVIKKLYFVNFLNLIGLELLISNKSLDCGWTWTEF